MRHHLHIHAGSREKLSTLGLYNKAHIDVSFPLKGRVNPLSSSSAIGRSGLENACQDWESSRWLGQWGKSFKHPNSKAQRFVLRVTASVSARPLSCSLPGGLDLPSQSWNSPLAWLWTFLAQLHPSSSPKPSLRPQDTGSM